MYGIRTLAAGGAGQGKARALGDDRRQASTEKRTKKGKNKKKREETEIRKTNDRKGKKEMEEWGVELNGESS